VQGRIKKIHGFGAMGGVFYRLQTVTLRVISYDLKIMLCHPINATLKGYSATLPRLMSRVRVSSPALLPHSPQSQCLCGSPVGWGLSTPPNTSTKMHPQGWQFEFLSLSIEFQNATPPCHPSNEAGGILFCFLGWRFFRLQRGLTFQGQK
jgi:hypothetical protein